MLRDRLQRASETARNVAGTINAVGTIRDAVGEVERRMSTAGTEALAAASSSHDSAPPSRGVRATIAEKLGDKEQAIEKINKANTTAKVAGVAGALIIGAGATMASMGYPATGFFAMVVGGALDFAAYNILTVNSNLLPIIESPGEYKNARFGGEWDRQKINCQLKKGTILFDTMAEGITEALFSNQKK